MLATCLPGVSYNQFDIEEFKAVLMFQGHNPPNRKSFREISDWIGAALVWKVDNAIFADKV